MATFIWCISIILIAGKAFSEDTKVAITSSTSTTTVPSTTTLGLTTISTNLNDTSPPSAATKTPSETGWRIPIPDNGSALMRAFYVVLSVTAIVVVYFVVRAVRLRRRKNKLRKYGIVGSGRDMEMTPLDQGDDDEDTTIFEASNRIRK